MDGSQGPHVPARRSDTHERFVAFAFAGADMVVETDAEGLITFAAGAFRSRFGEPAEVFVGRSIHMLFAPGDQEIMDQAVMLLASRGRLLPMTMRIADAARSALSVAGMVLGDAADRRLCFSIARPPAPANAVLRAGSSQQLARRTEARLRAGDQCSIEMLEIVPSQDEGAVAAPVIEAALESISNGVASALAPGRYGILSSRGADLASVAGLLESALLAQGISASVASQHLSMAPGGLSATQAARALRQALNVFARDGAEGLARAGFSDGLEGYMRRAGASAGRLRRAIRDGRFAMVFQPVVHLDTRAPHHHEALIRPQPVEGCAFANPQEFVLLVEGVGLADELDLAVARAACDAAAKAGTCVAFNISGQSAQSRPFRERLMSTLDAHAAVRAGLVMVEMTETADIDDLPEAVLTADALRALKVPFCLDDFGAGAADMRLLRALAAEIVKLDGSYVPGVAQGGRERAFVGGMVEIARAVGAEVVAERVETQAEADILRELGVRYGQGWLFGRPGALPARATVSRARRAGETECWG